MTPVARISIHIQQICGIAWSESGDHFATGGNNNLCCLFETRDILESNNHSYIPMFGGHRTGPGEPSLSSTAAYLRTRADFSDDTTVEDDGSEIRTMYTSAGSIRIICSGAEKHRWVHAAAVKAIAFCPWSPGLIATGGGSNDKCIRFFHTGTGSALATISVSAQVTGLIWSKKAREIVATFGYTNPEHSIRIAVFNWPECREVASVSCTGGHRALYAIPYPGSPGGMRGARPSRDCIAVATSDKTIKFHEVWSPDDISVGVGAGLLAGSDILEGLEGIEKDGEILR
jgi:meiosis-specific APC/C activator protein AMA1